MRVLPGLEASTGSLGQALAARVDERSYRVYVMIGDGESDEGQIWEAAMSAAKALKGRGLSPFQKDEVNRKHGVPLTEEEAEIALAELDEMKYDETFASQEFTPELTEGK